MEWNIVQLDCYPEKDGETDVVFTAHLDLTATEGEYSGRVYGSVGLTLDASAPFTSANTANGLSNGCFNINTSTQIVQPSVVANDTKIAALITNAGISATNANLSLATMQGGVSYFV